MFREVKDAFTLIATASKRAQYEQTKTKFAAWLAKPETEDEKKLRMKGETIHHGNALERSIQEQAESRMRQFQKRQQAEREKKRRLEEGKKEEDPYYEVLGVSPTCSGEELTTAYEKKVLQCMTGEDDEAQEQEADALFNRVVWAYDQLSDPLKRSDYDRRRAWQLHAIKTKEQEALKLQQERKSQKAEAAERLEARRIEEKRVKEKKLREKRERKERKRQELELEEQEAAARKAREEDKKESKRRKRERKEEKQEKKRRKKQKKASKDSSSASSSDSSSESNSGVFCEECERVVSSGFACAECNMTYCGACEAAYHSQPDILAKTHTRTEVRGDRKRWRGDVDAPAEKKSRKSKKTKKDKKKSKRKGKSKKH